MRRTSFGELVAIFAVAAALVYVLLHSFYDDLPPLHYYTVVPIAALAIVELVLARRVRGAVTHDPDARPIAAIAIARMVALGRASALTAAAIAGALGALLLRVGPDAGTVRAAANDLRVGSVLLAGTVLLLVAGLLLEAAGIDPQRRDGTGGSVGNR
jgi:hypothetical protein